MYFTYSQFPFWIKSKKKMWVTLTLKTKNFLSFFKLPSNKIVIWQAGYFLPWSTFVCPEVRSFVLKIFVCICNIDTSIKISGQTPSIGGQLQRSFPLSKSDVAKTNWTYDNIRCWLDHISTLLHNYDITQQDSTRIGDEDQCHQPKK